MKELNFNIDVLCCNLFIKHKKLYLTKPKFSILNAMLSRDTKLDNVNLAHGKLRGMKRISKRKYGTYNKAIDGVKVFKCFRWLDWSK